jgi:hypothetical protein
MKIEYYMKIADRMKREMKKRQQKKYLETIAQQAAIAAQNKLHNQLMELGEEGS